MDQNLKFKRNLLYYGFSKDEIEILELLFENKSLKVSEIGEKLGKRGIKKGPHLYKLLKNLLTNEWIEIEKKKPLIYKNIPNKLFQIKLDSIISATQDKFQLQKSNYYEIVEFLKQSDKPKSQGTRQINISKHCPPFIADWINKLLNIQDWDLLKMEANMVIEIRKDNLSFKLNSAEFEVQTKNNVYYGGINMCCLKSEAEQIQYLEKINQYNLDGRKFQFKLEKKGYFDAKNRDLLKYVIEDSIFDPQHKKYSSNIRIENKFGSSEGKIITFPFPNSKLWICSIWAEKLEMLERIQSSLSFLKPLE